MSRSPDNHKKAFVKLSQYHQQRFSESSHFKFLIDAEGRKVAYSPDKAVYFPWKELIVLLSVKPTYIEVRKYEDGSLFKYESLKRKFIHLWPEQEMFEKEQDYFYVEDVRPYIQGMYRLHIADKPLLYTSIPAFMQPDVENYMRDPFNINP